MPDTASTTTPAIWEIINPSDRVLIATDDFEVAAVVTCFLGSGQYGAKELHGEREMPIFLFGGSAEWFAKTFDRPMEDTFNLVTATKRDAMIACLRSAFCGDEATYREMQRIGQDDAGRAAWNDKRTSSLNNICGRAFQIADNIEKKAA